MKLRSAVFLDKTAFDLKSLLYIHRKIALKGSAARKKGRPK